MPFSDVLIGNEHRIQVTAEVAYDKGGSEGLLLTVVDLPQTELDDGVVVLGLLPDPPAQVHHLQPSKTHILCSK